MEITELNESEYLESSNLLREECRGLTLHIADVKEPDYQDTPCVDILFKVCSGPHEGQLKNERYFLTKTQKDQSTQEIIKRGSIWKFRKLIVAAGFFEEKEDPNGFLQRFVPDPFNTEELVGKEIIADAEFEEWEGNRRLRINNETYPKEYVHLPEVDKKVPEPFPNPIFSPPSTEEPVSLEKNIPY